MRKISTKKSFCSLIGTGRGKVGNFAWNQFNQHLIPVRAVDWKALASPFRIALQRKGVQTLYR